MPAPHQPTAPSAQDAGQLAACLADLEARLDDAEEERLWQAWKDFTDGRCSTPLFSPRRQHRRPAARPWPSVRVNAAIGDPVQMALQQYGACSKALAEGSGAILCVRANYGTGILPSLFGAEMFMMDERYDTLPTTRPLRGGAEAARRLLERGVPDVRAGLGAKVLEMGMRFAAWGREYPRVGRHVHIYHPDIQGPLDVCELLWGSALFEALYDEPDLVKTFLALLTQTYAAFLRAWDQQVSSPAGYAAHWGLLHRGHIMLRDDSAMNLAPRMCEEFAFAWDQRLLAECGGGAVHFCGRGDHFIPGLCKLEGLHGIQLSQPHLNDLEVIFRNTVDRGVVLLDFARPAAERALAAGRDLHGRVHCW